MNIQITIGGIRFRFESMFEMIVDESLTSFLYTDESNCDVNVKFICTEEKVEKPNSQMKGQDLLLEYYYQENVLICMAKGGKEKYLSQAVCDKSFQNILCYLNFKPSGKMRSLSNLLRLIPMCAILEEKQVLLFHSSQIRVQGKGILFMAPSGTGKTTQAKLWKKYRAAEMICNDRTLVKTDWTYGYPVDGSEPVRSGECCSLGAIVCLEKAEGNEIKRLKPSKALARLLEQLVFNSWNIDTRMKMIEQLIYLLNKYPIYLLRCTPDERAVLCLEQQLKKDGVI